MLYPVLYTCKKGISVGFRRNFTSSSEMNHILNGSFECENNEEKLLLGKGASVIPTHDEKLKVIWCVRERE